MGGELTDPTAAVQAATVPSAGRTRSDAGRLNYYCPSSESGPAVNATGAGAAAPAARVAVPARLSRYAAASALTGSAPSRLRSKRSAFITLFQATTKSATNFVCASAEP